MVFQPAKEADNDISGRAGGYLRMDAGAFLTPQIRRKKTMDRYVCTICGYVYDPEQGDPDNGVDPGTKWEDVPDDWECPVCGASKDDFEKEA